MKKLIAIAGVGRIGDDLPFGNLSPDYDIVRDGVSLDVYVV